MNPIVAVLCVQARSVGGGANTGRVHGSLIKMMELREIAVYKQTASNEYYECL